MAEYMSERELRVKRREEIRNFEERRKQLEIEERRNKLELEEMRKIVELEERTANERRIREETEQLLQERQKRYDENKRKMDNRQLQSIAGMEHDRYGSIERQITERTEWKEREDRYLPDDAYLRKPALLRKEITYKGDHRKPSYEELIEQISELNNKDDQRVRIDTDQDEYDRDLSEVTEIDFERMYKIIDETECYSDVFQHSPNTENHEGMPTERHRLESLWKELDDLESRESQRKEATLRKTVLETPTYVKKEYTYEKLDGSGRDEKEVEMERLRREIEHKHMVHYEEQKATLKREEEKDRLLAEEEYRRKVRIQLENERKMLEEKKVKREHDREMLEEERMKRELERYRKMLEEEQIRKEIAEKRRIREDELDRIRIQEIERKNLEDKIKEQIEKEMYRDRERKRKETRERQQREERELLESIKSLRVESSEGNEEENQMEDRLRILRKEKEMLQERANARKHMHEESGFDSHYNISGVGNTLGKPKLPPFDGDQFEEWKLEVTSLIESSMYNDQVLSQVIRHSITGKARKVLLTLKASASTREILKKMEDIYGNVRSGDAIVYDFYSAKQLMNEQCSEWGIRLETLFNQTVERGEIQESRKDTKLKERFWRGLHSEKIKAATRSSYESCESFDILRRKARIEELEIESEQGVKVRSDQKSSLNQNESETKSCQSIQNRNPTDAKLDALIKKIESLESSLEELRRKDRNNASFVRTSQDRTPQSFRYQRPTRSRGYYRNSWNRDRGRYSRDGNSATRWQNRQEGGNRDNSNTERKPLN